MSTHSQTPYKSPFDRAIDIIAAKGMDAKIIPEEQVRKWSDELNLRHSYLFPEDLIFPFVASSDDAGDGVVDEDRWLWIRDFVSARSDILLYFSSNNNYDGLLFSSGTDLVQVIEEIRIARSDYFLLSMTDDYLLFSGHEGDLKVLGSAASWLTRVRLQAFVPYNLPLKDWIISELEITDFGRSVRFVCQNTQAGHRTSLRFHFEGCAGLSFDARRFGIAENSINQFLTERKNKWRERYATIAATTSGVSIQLRFDYDSLRTDHLPVKEG